MVQIEVPSYLERGIKHLNEELEDIRVLVKAQLHQVLSLRCESVINQYVLKVFVHDFKKLIHSIWLVRWHCILFDIKDLLHDLDADVEAVMRRSFVELLLLQMI